MTNLLYATFLAVASYGATYCLLETQTEDECKALCYVRVTDDLTGGPAITYNFDNAVDGSCACSEPQTQDDLSWCEFVSACSGNVTLSFTSGPNVRWGFNLNPQPGFACHNGPASGLRPNDHPTGPYGLHGCGDSLQGNTFCWYTDNTPAANTNCDVLLGCDSWAIGCGVCSGECETL
jgi:hypothetical protein